jgi:hypothetical protein
VVEHSSCSRGVVSSSPVSALRPVQQKRALAIARMRTLLNYGEHCSSEASAREQSRVLALLNRPLAKTMK